jgi:hypothetical protein
VFLWQTKYKIIATENTEPQKMQLSQIYNKPKLSFSAICGKTKYKIISIENAEAQKMQ